jgi:hypothetical protein
MKKLWALAAMAIILASIPAFAGSKSDSNRPRIGHHSGTNGPSKAGWGGGGGYHH